MFWNDPILYGGTFPYKDISLQSPFVGPYATPWQNFPRFVPQVGMTPYQPFQPYQGFQGFQGYPPNYAFGQYLHPMATTPFVQPFQAQPFQAQPWNVQPWMQHLAQPFNLNLPLYNLQRGIAC